MGCGCKQKNPVVTPTVQTNKTTNVNQTAAQQDKLINEIIEKVKQMSR